MISMPRPSSGEKAPDQKQPSVAQLVISALAAFAGIQSDKNRTRDFQQNSAIPWIIAGISLTGCFVFGLIVVVKYFVV